MKYILPTTRSFSGSREPKEPRFSSEEVNRLIAFNQKLAYNFDEILARLTDNSEHMEFRPGYGPEVYTGLAKIDGFLTGIIGNRQGSCQKVTPSTLLTRAWAENSTARD